MKTKQKQFLNELYQKFNKNFKSCELYSDAPQDYKRNQSHIFVLSQVKKTNNLPPKLATKNDYWSRLYKELKIKRMSVSVLT